MTSRFDRDNYRDVLGDTHDHDFDIDHAEHDPLTGIWQIPFSSQVLEGCGCIGCLAAPLSFLSLIFLPNRNRPPRHPMDRILKVTHVRSWSCDDRAKIGINDLNTVDFDARQSRLTLEFNADCEVFLEVEPDFEIVLEP